MSKLILDVLLDQGYDLQVADGDFTTGESDDQHTALILLLSQGEYKQSPLTGVGLAQHLSGPMGATEQATLKREITLQLERDGYKITTLQLSDDGRLTLDAKRPS